MKLQQNRRVSDTLELLVRCKSLTALTALSVVKNVMSLTDNVAITQNVVTGLADDTEQVDRWKIFRHIGY